MPPLEDALIGSADGDFGLALIGFLVIAFVSGFYFVLNKMLDQNQKFHTQLIERMNDVALSLKEYHRDTCERITGHDARMTEQALCIKRTCERTAMLLETQSHNRDK